MTRAVKILGTGAVRPAGVLTSAELDTRFDKPTGFFQERTGIRSRPVCQGESSSGMAIAAARAALDNAGVEAAEIGLVISGCAVPEQPIPAMAPLIQEGIGLAQSGVFAFDINATCLSFLVALDYAATMIACGRIEKALIVSSEIASRALPWQHDPETAALFGDGAAAAVIGKASESEGSILAARFETYPAGYRFCELPAGGTRFDFYKDRANYEKGVMFHMDGRNVFRLTTQVIRPFLASVLQEAGLAATDLDVIIPHQASRGGVDHVMRKLGFTDGRTVDILADHGNQVAASLPSALHAARVSGKIAPGSKVLLLGTSAGLSLGAMILVA